MSSMKEEQRWGQYLANVAQENAERPTRGATALDPNTPENRESWNAAQVNDHGSLFPFSENLSTLMSTVACDLSEAQRETYKFLFSWGTEKHCLHLWSGEDLPSQPNPNLIQLVIERGNLWPKRLLVCCKENLVLQIERVNLWKMKTIASWMITIERGNLWKQARTKCKKWFSRTSW